MCKLLDEATKACADQNFNPFDEKFDKCSKKLQERRDDEAFVRAAALRINTRTLQFASDRLKADKEFMLTIISDFKLGLALEYASGALKGDVEFATLAVRNAGESHVVKVLKLCEEQIRDRHNTATWQGLWVKAAKAYPISIAASKSLPRALKNSAIFWRGLPADALEHLPDSIKGDTKKVLELLEYKVARQGHKWGRLLQYVKENIRDDVDKLHLLKTKGHRELCDSGYGGLSDPAFMLLAVRLDVHALECASVDLLSRRDFMLKAVKKNFDALKYVTELPPKDQGPFWLDVLNWRTNLLHRAPQELRSRADFMRMIVERSKDIHALKYADKALLSDRCFMLEAARMNVHALQYADKETLLKSKHFMSDAVKEVGMKAVLPYADFTFRMSKEFNEAEAYHKAAPF